MFNKFRANRKGTPVSTSPHPSLIYLSSPTIGNETRTFTAQPAGSRLSSYPRSQPPVLPPIRRGASRQTKNENELGSPTFSTTLTAILDEIAVDGSTSHNIGSTGRPEDDGTTEGIAVDNGVQMATSRSSSCPVAYSDSSLSPVPTMPTKFWVPQSNSPRPSQAEALRLPQVETTRTSQADAPRSYSYNSRLTDVSPNTSPSTVVPKSSRTRNLLHPRTMLMRRRTAQGIEAIDEDFHNHNNNKSFNVPAMNLPEDYDPRIIGKGVHDFSAPKPARDSGPPAIQAATTQAGVWEPPEFARRQSIPMLSSKTSALIDSTVNSDMLGMDLQPDKQPWHDSAETLDTSIISTSGAYESEGNEISPQESVRSRTHQPLISADRTSESTVISMRTSADRSTLQSLRSTGTRSSSPPQSTQLLRGQSGAALEPLNQPSRLRKHASSNASRYSRFSFQLDNDRSVEQERAMEAQYGPDSTYRPIDKQPLHDDAGGSAVNSASDDSNADNDFQESHNYEEALPSVNTEEPQEDAFDFTHSPFARAAPIGSHALANGDRVKSGEFLTTGNMRNLPQFHKPSRVSSHDDDVYKPRTTYAHDDDMYFDDGNIIPIEIDTSTSFNEDLLDDMTGPAMARYEHGRSALAITREDGKFGHDHLVPASTIDAYHCQDSQPTQSTGASIPAVLDAYHDALASAANQAAADGKFHRFDSLGIDIPADLPSQSSSPSTSPRQFPHALTTASSDAHAHSATGFGGGLRIGWDYDNDDFMFDDGDDSMIAAANAEALEADDAGFYGREFGFYGRAGLGDDDTAAFAGGYFNPAQQAAEAARAKNVVRDPNLTPITERSEYSRVNSFASMPHGIPGASALLSTSAPREAAPPATPGLRELAARYGPDDDDNLTLGHLIKLRKGTFGTGAHPSGGHGSHGSSPSLSSSPLASKELCPPSNHLQHSSAAASLATAPHVLPSPPRTSGPSAPRSPSASIPSPSSRRTHTPTASHVAASAAVPLPSPSQLSAFATRPPASSAAPAPGAALPPVARRQQQQAQAQAQARHSRAATASSVAYVREAAEDGRQQWWLERRRTLPSGEVVVLGRELVEGGTI